MEYGSSANCTLQPPSMPSAQMMFSAAWRSMAASSWRSVCVGATTMESPVCTPTGSTFSMLHTVMQLPAPSRMTSYSISFQPATLFSIRASCTREERRPSAQISRSCFSFSAKPPPVPPRVYAGRTMTG